MIIGNIDTHKTQLQMKFALLTMGTQNKYFAVKTVSSNWLRCVTE